MTDVELASYSPKGGQIVEAKAEVMETLGEAKDGVLVRGMVASSYLLLWAFTAVYFCNDRRQLFGALLCLIFPAMEAVSGTAVFSDGTRRLFHSVAAHLVYYRCLSDDMNVAIPVGLLFMGDLFRQSIYFDEGFKAHTARVENSTWIYSVIIVGLGLGCAGMFIPGVDGWEDPDWKENVAIVCGGFAYIIIEMYLVHGTNHSAFGICNGDLIVVGHLFLSMFLCMRNSFWMFGAGVGIGFVVFWFYNFYNNRGDYEKMRDHKFDSESMTLGSTYLLLISFALMVSVGVLIGSPILRIKFEYHPRYSDPACILLETAIAVKNGSYPGLEMPGGVLTVLSATTTGSAMRSDLFSAADKFLGKEPSLETICRGVTSEYVPLSDGRVVATGFLVLIYYVLSLSESFVYSRGASGIGRYASLAWVGFPSFIFSIYFPGPIAAWQLDPDQGGWDYDLTHNGIGCAVFLAFAVAFTIWLHRGKVTDVMDGVIDAPSRTQYVHFYMTSPQVIFAIATISLFINAAAMGPRERLVVADSVVFNGFGNDLTTLSQVWNSSGPLGVNSPSNQTCVGCYAAWGRVDPMYVMKNNSAIIGSQILYKRSTADVIGAWAMGIVFLAAIVARFVLKPPKHGALIDHAIFAILTLGITVAGTVIMYGASPGLLQDYSSSITKLRWRSFWAMGLIVVTLILMLVNPRMRGGKLRYDPHQLD